MGNNMLNNAKILETRFQQIEIGNRIVIRDQLYYFERVNELFEKDPYNKRPQNSLPKFKKN